MTFSKAKAVKCLTPLVETQALTYQARSTSQQVIPFKTAVLCFLLLVFCLVGCPLTSLGIFFFNSITCLYFAKVLCSNTTVIGEYVSTEAEADFPIYSHAKGNSLPGNVAWDYALNRQAAVIPG